MREPEIRAPGNWTEPEKHVVPLLLLTLVRWVTIPLTSSLLPSDASTDGSITIAAALLLLVIPHLTGRAMLTWDEASRADQVAGLLS